MRAGSCPDAGGLQPRRVWTASDGAPAHVWRIAQTPDGWLWLGRTSGLYRFDGVRFHPFAATNGARLLSPRISELAAQPNGDLYIGYDAPGLSLLRADGRLEHLAPATQDGPVNTTSDVVRDSDGSLWVGTSFGLRHLRDGKWSRLGAAQACPELPLTIAVDQGGQLCGADPGADRLVQAGLVLAGLLLLWLSYGLRLRFLTRTLTERLHAQMEERERIARELHDTVLQTFQGFVMKVTAMLPESESALGDTLRRALRDAKAAIEEGRGKLTALRAGTGHALSLHDYLRMAGEQDAAPGQHLTLRCEGQARPLHPVVEQELCAIGREALCNAFRHARARHHEAIVEYGPGALVLTVRDDGRGIDVGARDKLGHWGLRGIEERARLIHADARLDTAPGAGTSWRIEIKAALASADSRAGLRWPWRR